MTKTGTGIEGGEGEARRREGAREEGGECRTRHQDNLGFQRERWWRVMPGGLAGGMCVWRPSGC